MICLVAGVELCISPFVRLAFGNIDIVNAQQRLFAMPIIPGFESVIGLGIIRVLLPSSRFFLSASRRCASIHLFEYY